MNTWNSIAWFPICVGLTGAGLVLSWFAWRRRGVRRGVRLAAWSLVPLALYLTGSIVLVGRIGSAIVQFAQSFAFSPKTWSGVALLVLTVVTLLGTGGIPLITSSRKRARKSELNQASATATGAGAAVAVPAPRDDRVTTDVAAKPAKPAKRSKGGGGDGLDPDVAAILKRRGIT